MTPRYVILDRDGVINLDSPDFIKSAEEWLPISGSPEAIALFNRHGFKVVVISNQSGVGRGLFGLPVLEAIHAKMHRILAEAGGRIEAVYFCPHAPGSACCCRKPKPGMFQQFAQEYAVNLEQVYAIGDSLRDLQASEQAGAKPVLVKTGKGADTLAQNPQLTVPVFENLYDAANFIVA